MRQRVSPPQAGPLLSPLQTPSAGLFHYDSMSKRQLGHAEVSVGLSWDFVIMLLTTAHLTNDYGPTLGSI